MNRRIFFKYLAGAAAVMLWPVVKAKAAVAAVLPRKAKKLPRFYPLVAILVLHKDDLDTTHFGNDGGIYQAMPVCWLEITAELAMPPGEWWSPPVQGDEIELIVPGDDPVKWCIVPMIVRTAGLKPVCFGDRMVGKTPEPLWLITGKSNGAWN